MQTPMPEAVKNIVVKNVNDIEAVASEVDFCFSAVDMTKKKSKRLKKIMQRLRFRLYPTTVHTAGHRMYR